MNYFLTDEQKAIKKLARQIAEEKVKPVRQELDEKGEFPYEIMKEFSQAGLLGIYIPEEYGGAGGGVFEMCLVVEEISRICGGVGVCYAANGLAAYPIILSASEEQKKKYLPKMASGEWIGAFGLTEPNAGSDASSIQTTAVRDGDYYVLNGTKHFITNGEVAHLYTIIASTNPERGGRGLSAFIVEKGTPGFTFGKHENKMGIRASITTELIFQDCRVPVENRIGPEGTGFITAMRTFDRTRPGVGAQALGIAQGALEAATEYTQKRVQFGAPIASLQGIQFRLAEMATKIEAARALVYAAAKHADSGAKDIAGYSSMAKLFASDVAMQVTIEAVQLFGGYGYMKDYPVEKMMRDAKITQIYEGTNEIQRLVIARELLRGNLFKEY
ncbi:MAG: acyl-CoA dehydrogenase family protein [candidate division WOR-3 bacterium]|nr:acyl-CoA dehydrogenase family protein [candidate division WOR-3 bacterium]